MDFIGKLFKGDRVIWVIYLLLCLISMIEVYSASSHLIYKSGDYWRPITQHVSYLLIGVLVVWIVHNVNYKWFQGISLLLLLLSIPLLIFVSVFGTMTNGAARWLALGGIQFQPSELAKMAVVLSTALVLGKFQDEEGANPKAFKWIMLITMVTVLLIAPENLSTAMLLFGVVLLMMIIGNVPFRQWGKLVGCLAILGVLSVGLLVALPKNTFSSTPGLHRLTTWQNRITGFFTSDEVVTPEAYVVTDSNEQVTHANIAIATSHLVGKMPGNSVQRDFLSQAFSDFIFAIIIEELGLIGGAFVVFLYICLLFRVGYIAKRAKGNFASILIIGIALLLVSQALLNMMVAVGLFPVTGQPLPLISKGGTSTLINCVYIGMILSVSRYTLETQQKEENGEQVDASLAEPSSAVLQDKGMTDENR